MCACVLGEVADRRRAIFWTNTCENSKATFKQYSGHLKGFDDINVRIKIALWPHDSDQAAATCMNVLE